jgi:sentrin-specific protease 8
MIPATCGLCQLLIEFHALETTSLLGHQSLELTKSSHESMEKKRKQSREGFAARKYPVKKQMTYLQWKSTNLYVADMALLAPPHWFNDNLITFCCDYLQHVTCAGRPFRFVPPGTAFVLLHEDDPQLLKECVEGSGITGKELVLFPVNNAPKTCEACGTHWSLLVFEARSQRFYAYDSLHTTIPESTRRLAAKLAPLLCTKPARLFFLPSANQSNSYDCGCFCVMNMRQVAQRAAANKCLADGLLRDIHPTDERRAIRKRIERIRILVSVRGHPKAGHNQAARRGDRTA